MFVFASGPRPSFTKTIIFLGFLTGQAIKEKKIKRERDYMIILFDILSCNTSYSCDFAKMSTEIKPTLFFSALEHFHHLHRDGFRQTVPLLI